jgi:hypothetical protein
MAKGDKMESILSVYDIQALGFEWPKTPIIEQYSVVEDGKINLEKTLEYMRKSHAFYKSQIIAAFNFKSQTGADYSDFTDKFDDYARAERLLGEAIRYLEQILEAYLAKTSI